MTVTLSARNAELADLVTILSDQAGRKLDVVAPASTLRSRGGLLILRGVEPVLTPDAVEMADGAYRPTAVFDEGLAEKLGIPVGYVKRLRAERPDLLDLNLNGLLRGWRGGLRRHSRGPVADPDARNFLIRAFRGDAEGEPGVARALLSDGYRRIDNFDVLTSVLDGARDADTEVRVEGCDLSERRMSVRMVAPAVTALAPNLLRAYRSPFDGGEGAPVRAGWTLERARAAAANEGLGFQPGEEPIVWAGLVAENSETGGGAYSLTPRVVILACRNGLRLTVDAIRAVHLGARMDSGIVQWSEETQATNLQLIRQQARDAVATFLNPEYLARVVDRVDDAAGARLQAPIPDVVRIVSQRHRIPEAYRDEVLAHFIRGGQTTAGGVLNALTSVAQTVADPDDSAHLENVAFDAMLTAAGLRA